MTAIRKSVLMLSTIFFAATASAQDVNFLLTNQSGYTLVEFYASPENVSSWEEDILGYDVLESGYVLNIIIADNRSQCIYDMRMVFDDGDELLDTVNICEMSGYTINP
jgi:hypothetical protein